MKKTLFHSAFMLACIAISLPSEAQLPSLKRKKKEEKTETPAQNNNNSNGAANNQKSQGLKIVGEDLIDLKFTEDEQGISGVYYYQNKRFGGVYPAKIQMKLCEGKSKVKGAENMPTCVMMNLELVGKFGQFDKPEAMKREYEGNYAYAANWERKNPFTFKSDSSVPFYTLAPGVLLFPPDNMSSSLCCENSIKEMRDELWEYLAKSSSILVKNKEDLGKWENVDVNLVKEKVAAQHNQILDIYSEQKNNRTAKTDMPAIGKLNTKFIQDRALKTYSEKYNPINKGWKHHYMYVHGNEWVNKKAKDRNGILRDTHRELQVVIVRTSPSGECRADLMFYVELFENGKYNAANGKVTGPVSYIGMPGGVIPCQKVEEFKSKLAK